MWALAQQSSRKLAPTVSTTNVTSTAATSSSKTDLRLWPNGVNWRPERRDPALFGDQFALA